MIPGRIFFIAGHLFLIHRHLQMIPGHIKVIPGLLFFIAYCRFIKCEWPFGIWVRWTVKRM